VGPGTVGAMVAVDSLVGMEVGSILGVLQADNTNTMLNPKMVRIDLEDILIIFFITHLIMPYIRWVELLIYPISADKEFPIDA
jgi:hypothetical protein